jgi:hypothetical protein
MLLQLYMFDGHKRSCRTSLEKRRSPADASSNSSSSSSSQQGRRRRRTDPAPQLPADVLLAMGVYDEAPVPGSIDKAAATASALGAMAQPAIEAAGAAAVSAAPSYGFSGGADMPMASAAAAAAADQAGAWGNHLMQQQQLARQRRASANTGTLEAFDSWGDSGLAQSQQQQ